MPELEPVAIGPTWKRNPDGKFVWPELSLAGQVIEWVETFLRQPDGANAGEPWVYTPEQVRFLAWWFAIDEKGRWLYRSGMLRRVKGWGKDPIGATLLVVEFVGPCRFAGFDTAGNPVAAPHPASWCLTAAVAKDQTRNTMSLMPGILSPAVISEYGIDVGKEILYANGGQCRLEAVTSSPRALEGPRATFTLKNETQHWLLNNDGHEMSKVIARNAAKSRDGSARVLAISNAHQPGEDSDAEHDYEAWQTIDQGKSRSRTFLYDSIEAPADIEISDEEQLRAGLAAARGDSVWLTIDNYVDEFHDTRNSVATLRRFYLNQIVAAEDAWLIPLEWDRLADELIAATIAERDQITLGLDPSASSDHTVLIGCRVSDGFVFTLGAWDPEEHDGETPRELVDETVTTAFQKYTVLGFFSDLHPFESYVDKWAEEHGRTLKVKASAKHPIAWDMRGRQKETTIEIERLHNEIVEQVFKHDGNARVAQHFHNARRRPNAWGVTVGKEHRESRRKIDAVPAVMLARTARRYALDKRKPDYRTRGFV